MHTHIHVLREYLDESHISYTKIQGFEDSLMIGDKAFIRSTTPFNNESTAALCLDKDAVLKLVGEKIRIPKTRSFIDPKGSRQELCAAKSIDEIVHMTLDFLYPRVVKMNSGQSGRNVHVVKNEAEFRTALENIFDTGRRGYDYIALVQEHIDVGLEYRVAVSAGEPVFAYAKGVYETIDGERKVRLFDMARKIIYRTGLSWGSVDFLEGKDAVLYFLEVNTKPLYGGFIAKNGTQVLKDLFARALGIHAWNRSKGISIDSSLQDLPVRPLQ